MTLKEIEELGIAPSKAGLKDRLDFLLENRERIQRENPLAHVDEEIAWLEEELAKGNPGGDPSDTWHAENTELWKKAVAPLPAIYHYGDQTMVRPEYVDAAIAAKTLAQRVALTEDAPASRQFFEIEEQLTDAEHQMVEDTVPGPAQIPDWYHTMPSNPKKEGNPGNPTVAANLQLLRQDAEGELATISQYERHILDLQDDPKAKHTLEHIEAEEKTHLAELSRLIAQRNPTQGAELEAKLKAIESHLDAIAASTLDMPSPELPGESVRDWLPSVSGSPGIVVDPGIARSTPCIEIELGKGRKPLTYSKGIVGALDQDQRSLYCQQGMETRPATEKQQKRLAAMEAAAKLCSQEATGTTTEEHLKNYYGCLGRELRANGVEPW